MPQPTTDAPTRAIIHLREALTASSIAFLRAEDFDRAHELTQIAREVKELEVRIQRILGSQADRPASTTDSPGLRARPRGDFPRFHRQGQVLVRTGLRRDRKTTYEQRCPWPEFAEVVEAVRAEVEIGEEFEAQRIKNRVKCPDYQTYLVLGLLEWLDYLGTPRRGIHRIKGGGGLGSAEEVWSRIPQDA